MASSSDERHHEVELILQEAKKGFESQSLLHVASQRGCVEHIHRLVILGADVNEISQIPSDLVGVTPLMVAAMFNTPDVLRCLIELGANVSARGKSLPSICP